MQQPVQGCQCYGVCHPRSGEEADRNAVLGYGEVLMGVFGGMISQIVPCLPCLPFAACALCSTTYSGLNRLFRSTIVQQQGPNE